MPGTSFTSTPSFWQITFCTTVPIKLRLLRPATFRFALAEADLQAEIVRLTDWYTEELFALLASVATSVIFPYSRFFVDVERYRDDAEEPMSARGMGAVYTATTHGTSLRTALAASARERLVATYYDPHHEALTQAVNSALEYRSRCLIIDAHSFPSHPLPCDRDQSEPRPHFCIGTDRLHTPHELVKLTASGLQDHGWTLKVDAPYAGTIVPSTTTVVTLALQSYL